MPSAAGSLSSPGSAEVATTPRPGTIGQFEDQVGEPEEQQSCRELAEEHHPRYLPATPDDEREHTEEVEIADEQHDDDPEWHPALEVDAENAGADQEAVDNGIDGAAEFGDGTGAPRDLPVEPVGRGRDGEQEERDDVVVAGNEHREEDRDEHEPQDRDDVGECVDVVARGRRGIGRVGTFPVLGALFYHHFLLLKNHIIQTAIANMPPTTAQNDQTRVTGGHMPRITFIP